ncbi:uncharacterized protein SCHCODRAFT_02695189 [Schizophyllum commune H4-8]|uniref:uncharacterized protein n=1 Tax=Schizophyllum commune (strain H4-8 / FGSC 9210) TaxID=578458 RepID=UPI002160CD01|nr:uncharacterized protein SCHCODRAFT_02695189 [Schizophyllum commune H4-8]KAI5899930.1 hypothetical protein SCHCODRAFT_02695189 [Schizophyllum commune H4-8]
MSGDIRAAVSALQKATKRQRKKDILAGVESLQASLPLLDLSSPSDASLRKLLEHLRAPLLPLYADHTEAMLDYCRAVLVYISDKKIGAFTGPGKDELRESWEPVLDSLLNGVIDFLENSTKKTDGKYQIKAAIGDKLYSTLCRLYFPDEKDDIVTAGPSLLSAVYMLMSDAAIRHSDNRRRLRSSEFLGPKRIGWMLAQTKEFVVIEHLLEVFATALPSSKDQGGQTRQKYIEDVFDPALFRCHDEAINILANMRSADWSETSPHIMATLAEGSLTYPQPFDVSGFLVGDATEQLDHGKLYVDDKGFYANVEQDDAFDHLRAPYRTVVDIRITSTKDNANSVRVALQTPPLLGKEPYSMEKAGSRFDLKFRIKARDADRFKKALKARGLASVHLMGNKVLAADKRMSTATIVVEFDKDIEEPMPSTQSKVKMVEEVWNSSTVDGAIVIEPTSPLMNESDEPLPLPPPPTKSIAQPPPKPMSHLPPESSAPSPPRSTAPTKATRPKPRAKPARREEGESDKDPFIINRKRMRVPDSEDDDEVAEAKKSRTDATEGVTAKQREAKGNAVKEGVKAKNAKAAINTKEASKGPLRDKKRPPPESDIQAPASTEEPTPPAKRTRLSAKDAPAGKENPANGKTINRSKTAMREIFTAHKPDKPIRVAKRYGKAGRSSSPGRKSGRASSPAQTATTAHPTSDFDFIPGSEATTKKPAVKEAMKKKEAATKAKAGKLAKENKAKATLGSKAKAAAESKAKTEKKMEAKKKVAATMKEKEPSSTSALSSDPIEDDEVVKPAKGRDSTIAPVRKGVSATKTAEAAPARRALRDEDAEESDNFDEIPKKTSVMKVAKTPWEDVKSKLRTPAKSKDKSRTSKLLAAMNNNLSSPIFGGFDEPLTPIDESDTEAYVNFVQDLPLATTSDADLASSRALDSAADSRSPVHIDLTTDTPRTTKAEKSKTRASSASTHRRAFETTDDKPAPTTSTDVLKDSRRSTANRSAPKTQEGPATHAKETITKALSSAVRPQSHIKTSLPVYSHELARSSDVDELRADKHDAPHSRTTKQQVKPVDIVSTDAMPPPRMPVRSKIPENNVFASSSPHRLDRRTSGSTTLVNDSARTLHSILRSTGISNSAKRLAGSGLSTSKNTKAGMWPGTPSPPENLQRRKSHEAGRMARRDYIVPGTPAVRASPLVEKATRDVLLPRSGKPYIRPETTKSRTYAGIEDIIEVLNDIHEVIIDKVSGRFVNVKKDVRLGRYAMLKDAADDFRAMQQESREHYEAIFGLQEEYADHCRTMVDSWGGLHQAGRDLTKGIAGVVQRHDRGSLVVKFPTSLVPALPASLKS